MAVTFWLKLQPLLYLCKLSISSLLCQGTSSREDRCCVAIPPTAKFFFRHNEKTVVVMSTIADAKMQHNYNW